MHKLKQILLTAAVMLAAVSVAGRTASEFFVSAPGSVLPLLSEATRLDMLDYFRYGADRASRNTFGGEARLRAESPAVVRFDVDNGVAMDIAVLPAGRDTVLAVVTTISLPVEDSRLDFYNADWTPRRKAPVRLPAYEQWLTPAGRADRVELMRLAPFMSVKAYIDDDVSTLTLTNGALTMLEESDSATMAPLVLEKMVYDISGQSFKLRK